ncbi:MAG: ferredoxin [Syntrophales bacterium]
MRVIVDKELCIGCEACIDLCPEAFEMRDDVAASKFEKEIPRELEKAVREAAESCAVAAIIIEE